jgi:hypothetical protein
VSGQPVGIRPLVTHKKIGRGQHAPELLVYTWDNLPPLAKQQQPTGVVVKPVHHVRLDSSYMTGTWLLLLLVLLVLLLLYY